MGSYFSPVVQLTSLLKQGLWEPCDLFPAALLSQSALSLHCMLGFQLLTSLGSFLLLDVPCLCLV